MLALHRGKKKKSIILAFLFHKNLYQQERGKKKKEKCCGLSARSRDDFMEAAQRRHLLIKTYESSPPGCLLQAPSPTLSHLIFLIFSPSVSPLLSPLAFCLVFCSPLFHPSADSMSFTGLVVDLEAANLLIRNQYRPGLSFIFLSHLRTDEKIDSSDSNIFLLLCVSVKGCNIPGKLCLSVPRLFIFLPLSIESVHVRRCADRTHDLQALG